MGRLVTRIGTTGALATVLVGGIVSTSEAITPPVITAQQIAGPALTDQVRWYGYGYGWRGYGWGGWGGAFAAGAILGGIVGLAATAPYYGWGYPGFYGYPAYYAYPGYYGGYYPVYRPWPYYRRAYWRPYGWGYRRVYYARPYRWWGYRHAFYRRYW
jgi:hypothetical protein